jgi:hypothetical protein
MGIQVRFFHSFITNLRWSDELHYRPEPHFSQRHY